MGLSTKKIVRNLIKAHQKSSSPYLSKVLAVLSQRPFNMKGQEIEEIMGLLIKQGLKSEFSVAKPIVQVPQTKALADVIFEYDGKKSFEIKSYGGATRFQLSTLKNILQDIRDRYVNSQARKLDKAEKTWLINKIKSIPIAYTLSFLSFQRNDKKISIHIFDHENLDISRFAKLDFQLRIVAAEKRPEIHCNITDRSTLEISAGGNALNRGMWINQVASDDDMKKIYKTGFLEPVVPVEVIELKNFDKNEYVLDKAERTVEIVRSYFK